MFAIIYCLEPLSPICSSRRRLEVETLFLRHQLNIILRLPPQRLRLRGSDRVCVPKTPSLLIFGKDGFCHELAFPVSVLLRRTPSALMPMAASLYFRGRMTSLPTSDRPPGFSARGSRADASHRPRARGYALRPRFRCGRVSRASRAEPDN